MHYKISSSKPHTHFIDIELTIENISSTELLLHLPLWRPGRYEFGNFAKNIQKFKAVDMVGNELSFVKTDKSTWKINCNESETVIVKYNYYANQPDAGACFCNSDMLYVNPIHCAFYVTEKMNEIHSVEIHVPFDWKIATSMSAMSETKFSVADYDELVDSPFIASPHLKHCSYTSTGKTFHLWIEGDFRFEENKLIENFVAFTDLQIDVMRDIPCNVYHFLILALPFKFRHGVEHVSSTVLALGPADKLHEREMYNELIAIASHELFHVWNVKTIRPVEMMPYKYASENYAREGFVYEGVTTYYGDLFLVRCNYFSITDYFKQIDKRLMKHMHNAGRFNLSVADSSFDTWLDGYVAGVPDRKVSIYDEGSLIALMLDLLIINQSNCKYSLDDVMRNLYNDFGKKKHGYSGKDFIAVCEYVAGIHLQNFFDNYVFGAMSYDQKLIESLNFVGCSIEVTSSEKLHEQIFGIKILEESTVAVIANIYPDSPADNAGLTKDDAILTVNGEEVNKNLDYLLLKYADEEMILKVNSFHKEKLIQIHVDGKNYYNKYAVVHSKVISEKQKQNFDFWLGRKN